jgi:hypothetical protein
MAKWDRTNFAPAGFAARAFDSPTLQPKAPQRWWSGLLVLSFAGDDPMRGMQNANTTSGGQPLVLASAAGLEAPKDAKGA